jgi:hypothetical protein
VVTSAPNSQDLVCGVADGRTVMFARIANGTDLFSVPIAGGTPRRDVDRAGQRASFS